MMPVLNIQGLHVACSSFKKMIGRLSAEVEWLKLVCSCQFYLSRQVVWFLFLTEVPARDILRDVAPAIIT